MYQFLFIGGVFLPVNNISEKTDIRFLMRAVLAWFLAAVILLLLASLIVSKASISSGTVGYISSALSFLAALFAGAKASSERRKGNVYTGLITGAAIVTLLLTIGFLIEGTEMESDGILSVVTFTFAGCLAGAVLLPGGKTRAKKTRFSPGQRKTG